MRKGNQTGDTSEGLPNIRQALVLGQGPVLLVAMSFLLGRAMILEQLAPFAIAFFAVVYFIRPDVLRWVGAALLAGSLFAAEIRTVELAAELLVFLLLQKGLERFERAEVSYAPFLVFVSAFMVQLFSSITAAELNWYALTMTGVDALLSFILTLIFVQALSVFTPGRKNYHLKNEEIICLVILLASVMTGTVGWVIYGVSVEHFLSRYLILIFALAGGAPLGASVGVIAGLILSLANLNAIVQMSLLAFSGLLAGLLKDGGKWAVAVGMLLGVSILSVYLDEAGQILYSLGESLGAVVLFMLTPKRWLTQVSKYVPGTQENMKSQYDYAKRVRDVTAQRVAQFSEVFRQLSRSFKQLTGQEESGEPGQGREADHFMNAVTDKTCGSCGKQRQCWEFQFKSTYQYMTDMMTVVEANPAVQAKDIPMSWRKQCNKTETVLETMKRQYELYQNNLHWKRQIQDSRQLVAEQLTGVSQVMEDLAKEIRREGQELFVQEEQIRSALESLGLSIQSIDIICLEEGNVEIEIVHRYTRGYDECRKIIAPLLSDILGENIAVKKEQSAPNGEGASTVMLASAKEYEVETGVAYAAKGGELLSGDSFSTAELGNGKFAVALSDGMGNGERARAESSAALSILQQLLRSGMDERLAVKSVNSVLLLRSSDEMYATVDVALIDLYHAKTTFLKIGSTPSFIKRGQEVIPVSSSNLPVGILQDIDIDLVRLQLLPGDMLIMMTDGIYDAPGHAVNKDLWMRRMIQEIEVQDSQEFADCLLERIVRHHQGDIVDDMTVVVARIEKYKPEWATFRWPGTTRIERPRTVS
ncbi:stage II sporulation protein E [Paenibacillus sp. y28]|uniref:stage II sporulation protein E n=1 Tax=Paenibacillus sp. y28 TaxID=3129110 RepID=UPI0030166577